MVYVNDQERAEEMYDEIVHKKPYHMRRNIAAVSKLLYFVLIVVDVFLYGRPKVIVWCTAVVLLLIWAFMMPACCPEFLSRNWKKMFVDTKDFYLIMMIFMKGMHVSYTCAYYNIERVVYNEEMRRLEIYGKFDKIKQKGTGEVTPPRRVKKVFIYESVQNFDELRKVVEDKVAIANRSNTIYALQERMDKIRSMRNK